MKKKFSILIEINLEKSINHSMIILTFLDPVYDSNGNPVTFKSKSRPYNPIELE